MKICLIHNEYGKISGEEIVVNRIIELLRANGHDVTYFQRSSAEIPEMRFGKLRAFFSALYSPSSKRAVKRLLVEKRPNVVHIHNLFPLISPSILPECKRVGVPVVMTVHNYRLVCPNGLHMVHGEVCEKCCGGREYWCVLRNCEGNPAKSLGYALRNYVARKRRYYLDNVTICAVLTEFQRGRLVNEGFPADRIVVIPNAVDGDDVRYDLSLGEYVGFVGRISPEKNVPSLIAAAQKHSDISFKAAGAYDRMPDLPDQAPSNFEFLGHVGASQIADFYNSARIIVLCSVWFEGFPMVFVESMIHGKPIVCSQIGGLSEIVEEGKTGLLFEPGNAEDLAEKIRYLWERPELCAKMGEAGREKALREYSLSKYYERLMGVYKKALTLCNN
jgi:glycosyltransferase involved in cell wall biosynthesis